MSQSSNFPILAPDDIPPSGFEVSLSEPHNTWAIEPAAEGAGGTVVKLAGKLKVRRVKIHLFVTGHMSGHFVVPCDRCGEPLKLNLRGQIACLYSPLSSIPERSEDEDGDFPLPEGLGEIAAEVKDQGEYDPQGLDARDVVREFFVIERPSSLRCEDQDPTLEATCMARWKRAGQNLDLEASAEGAENDPVKNDVEKDEVGPPVIENPFSVLARLKRSH